MSEAHRRQLFRSPWLRVVAIGVVVAAWGWFLQGQLADLRQYPWRIEPLPFVGGVFWGALYFAGLALCWTLLLRTTGGAARGVGLLDGAYIWLSTMLARYVPGNIWHIVGRVALAGRLGVGRAQVAASAAVEQLLTLLGALALFGVSLPFWRGGRAELWLLLLIPAGLALLHPRIFGALLGWAATRLGRPELAWPYTYSEMLGILGAYTLANLGAGLSLYVIVAAIAAVEPAQAPFLAGAAALAWAVGYLSFLTPSGLGVREAALTAFLAQLFPLPVAIVASLLHRVALTVGEAAAFSGAALWMRLRPPPPVLQPPSDQEEQRMPRPPS
jgi:uncharacterized membrane protein YbhN (UPF0104 family)